MEKAVMKRKPTFLVRFLGLNPLQAELPHSEKLIAEKRHGSDVSPYRTITLYKSLFLPHTPPLLVDGHIVLTAL
jgi:hypothetical protein